MHAYRPDRVVRVLTGLTSFAYFTFWVLGTGVLIGLAVVPVLAARGVDVSEWRVGVPVTLRERDEPVGHAWGEAAVPVSLEEELEGVLRVPLGEAPGWFIVSYWLWTAAGMTLLLLFLHHLRRLFQRVRAGAPFDAQNARRVRWLGLILLVLSLAGSVVEWALSLAVTQSLSGNVAPVDSALRIDEQVIFVALVLLALSTIFRRGSELEDEQALVV